MSRSSRSFILTGLNQARLCLAGFALLILVALPSHAQAATVLVVGDSISAAYGMSLQQGWVAKMAEALKKINPDTNVVNASISGETSIGGLRRLPGLLQEHSPGMVIIELGGNDGLRGYPLKKFRSNLSQMIELSQQQGAKVILIPMEIPPNYGSRYTTGFRQSFRDVTEEHGNLLTPFILDGIATDPALMQDDGIHPTVEAQPLLLDNILPAVIDVMETL